MFRWMYARDGRGVCLVLGLAFTLSCSHGQRLPEVPLLAPRAAVRSAAKDPGPVRVLLARWHYELRADGTYRNTYTHRYKILDQRGVDDWGFTAGSWNAWYQKRPSIVATVTAPNGAVTKLDPATLSERPAYPDAPDTYGDAKVIQAPLPNVVVGAVVEETIVTESHRRFFEGGQTQSLLLQSQVARDKVELVIDAPKDLHVEIDVQGAEVARSEEIRGDTKRIVIQGGPYEALEAPEELLPPEVSRWPHVAFSTGTSWQAVARAYSEVVERQLAGVDFASTTQKIVASGDSPLEKARKIHAWLKERIRYTAVEFGESSIVPRTPVETMTTAYGDCKDQATLLTGLLRAAGVDAHVVLLRSGVGEDVAPALPTLDVFNHAIVLANLETPLFIDPTADLITVGELPVADQNRLALVADPASKGLVRTPVPGSASSVYRERRVVQLAEEGPANVVEESSGTGWHDWSLRDQGTTPQAKERENLRDYVKREYDATDVGDIRHGEPRDLAKPFALVLEAKRAKLGGTEPFEASEGVGAGAVFSWLPEALTGSSEKPRKNDLQLTVPYQATTTWEVHPPEGFVATGIPNDTVTQLGRARLTRAARRLDGGAVEVRYSLDAPPRWTAAEVEAFRTAYKKWGAEPLPFVTFQHRARQAIDQGEIVKATADLRKDLERQPKSALAHLRFGAAVADLGFGEVARAQAREAIALAPEDGYVQRHAAHLLALGDLGGDRQKGFDRTGALAAYRKAASLDENDIYSRLRVGVLLEYDDKGHRYQIPDLAAACTYYDSLDSKRIREFDNGSFVNNPLWCLLEAGKLEELAQRIEAMPAGTVPAEVAVSGAALRGGARAALKEVERLGLSKETRSTALAAASARLYRVRQYAGAADLLEQSASGGDAAVKTSAMVRTWRKMQKTEPRSLVVDAPEKVISKLLATVLAHPEDRVALVKTLVSSRAWNDRGKSEIADVIEKWDISKTLAPEVSPELLGDGAVSGFEAQTIGNDRVGYRVSASIDNGTNLTRLQAFVVKEGGRYQLRGFKDDVTELGAEALYAATHGELERAKQWLTWANENWNTQQGDDPLRRGSFAPLWNDGKGDVVLAAAALAAQSIHAASAIPTLEKALAKAGPGETATALKIAMLNAYRRLERWEDMVTPAKALLAEFPESDTARRYVAQALWELERNSEHESLVRSIMAKGPAQKRAWRFALAANLERRSLFKEVRRIQEEIIGEGEPSAELLNAHAWLGLFVNPTEADLAEALRAAQMGQRRDPSILHTLATLQADLGHFADALETLKAILALRENNEPVPVDRYVIGRIAEGLGLRDAARKAYALVPKPEKPTPAATYHLAQQRLKKL